MSFTTEQILSQARTIADIPLHRLAYVPSDEEAASIREAADELRVLDVQLTAQIANLLAQQAAVRKQIAVNDALLAPIRRVPLELLFEIFLLAVPDDWDAAYVGQRKLGFVCVCHQWRDVALGTPRLWSKLRFGEYQNWETLSEDVGRLETELARTAQAHLDVVFEIGQEGMRSDRIGRPVVCGSCYSRNRIGGKAPSSTSCRCPFTRALLPAHFPPSLPSPSLYAGLRMLLHGRRLVRFCTRQT